MLALAIGLPYVNIFINGYRKPFWLIFLTQSIRLTGAPMAAGLMTS